MSNGRPTALSHKRGGGWILSDTSPSIFVERDVQHDTTSTRTRYGLLLGQERHGVPVPKNDVSSDQGLF